MDTGLEYEGESARRRFVVYWLRPAVAAIGFGLFTFLVVSVPGEKEKIHLREELQRLRIENEGLQAKLRGLTPFATAGRSPGLTTVPLGEPGETGGWGRILYDERSGRGVVVVNGLEADGRRAFCWWRDRGGKRHPLAAIELTEGSGDASIQLDSERRGSFVVTLEPLEGEPTEDGPAVLEAAVPRDGKP